MDRIHSKREEYWTDDPQYFSDWNHLNHDGAVYFSTLFSGFFTGEISEEELFYDSYAEKLNEMPPSIFGLIIKEQIENSCITIKPITNADIANISYQIVIKQGDNEDSIFVPDAEYLTEIFCPAKTTGSIEITTFLDGKEGHHIEFAYGEKE